MLRIAAQSEVQVDPRTPGQTFPTESLLGASPPDACRRRRIRDTLSARQYSVSNLRTCRCHSSWPHMRALPFASGAAFLSMRPST